MKHLNACRSRRRRSGPGDRRGAARARLRRPARAREGSRRPLPDRARDGCRPRARRAGPAGRARDRGGGHGGALRRRRSRDAGRACGVAEARSRHPALAAQGRYYEYERASPRRPIWPWLLAALLLAAAGVAGYFVYTKIDQRLAGASPSRCRSSRACSRSSPSRRSRTRASTPKIERRPNEKVRLRHRVRPEPAAGDHVDKGDQVVIVVSNGKAKVEVPDVGKHSRDDAVAALTSRAQLQGTYRGLLEQAAGHRDRPVARPAGRGVKGTTVRINVSKGLPPVVVPSDDRQDESDATNAALERPGSTSDRSRGLDKPQGTVVDTNPKPARLQRRLAGDAHRLQGAGRPRPCPTCAASTCRRRGQTISAAGFKVVIVSQDTSDHDRGRHRARRDARSRHGGAARDDRSRSPSATTSRRRRPTPRRPTRRPTRPRAAAAAVIASPSSPAAARASTRSPSRRRVR